MKVIRKVILEYNKTGRLEDLESISKSEKISEKSPPLPKCRGLIGDFSFKWEFFWMLRNDLTINGEVFNVSDITKQRFFNVKLFVLYWARSLKDRISGFGPADRGSIPRGLIEWTV